MSIVWKIRLKTIHTKVFRRTQPNGTVWKWILLKDFHFGILTLWVVLLPFLKKGQSELFHKENENDWLKPSCQRYWHRTCNASSQSAKKYNYCDEKVYIHDFPRKYWYLFTKRTLSENKWRDLLENPQMSFQYLTNLTSHFDKQNFADRFLVYDTYIEWILLFITIYYYISMN